MYLWWPWLVGHLSSNKDHLFKTGIVNLAYGANWIWEPEQTRFVSGLVWQWGYIMRFCLFGCACGALSRSKILHWLSSKWLNTALRLACFLSGIFWNVFWSATMPSTGSLFCGFSQSGGFLLYTGLSVRFLHSIFA